MSVERVWFRAYDTGINEFLFFAFNLSDGEPDLSLTMTVDDLSGETGTNFSSGGWNTPLLNVGRAIFYLEHPNLSSGGFLAIVEGRQDALAFVSGFTTDLGGSEKTPVTDYPETDLALVSANGGALNYSLDTPDFFGEILIEDFAGGSTTIIPGAGQADYGFMAPSGEYVVVANTTDNILRAYSAATGDLLWSADIGYETDYGNEYNFFVGVTGSEKLIVDNTFFGGLLVVDRDGNVSSISEPAEFSSLNAQHLGYNSNTGESLVCASQLGETTQWALVGGDLNWTPVALPFGPAEVQFDPEENVWYFFVYLTSTGGNTVRTIRTFSADLSEELSSVTLGNPDPQKYSFAGEDFILFEKTSALPPASAFWQSFNKTTEIIE